LQAQKPPLNGIYNPMFLFSIAPTSIPFRLRTPIEETFLHVLPGGQSCSCYTFLRLRRTHRFTWE